MISNAINSDLMGVCAWFFECFLGSFYAFWGCFGVFNVFGSKNMSLRANALPISFCIEFLSFFKSRLLVWA